MTDGPVHLEAEPAYLTESSAPVVWPPVTTAPQVLPLGDLSWENLERLCVRLVDAQYEPIHIQLYGVRGQDQRGIDLYARLENNEHLTLQSRRIKTVTADGVRAAVDDFVAGSWADSKIFVYATSADMSATKIADEIEAQAQRLSDRGVQFVTWDRERMSSLLKLQPLIVHDFFGQPWRDLFCTSLATEEHARAVYAGHLDDFAARARVDEWDASISPMLFHGQPSLEASVYKRLCDLLLWLQTRHWPAGLDAMRDAFANVGLVLNDLLSTFAHHGEESNGVMRTSRFYKIPGWDPELYHSLLQEFNEHVALVEDLVLELTRAINYLFDVARATVDPNYRIHAAVLTVETGPDSRLEYHRYRPEYRGVERVRAPYPGLDDFLVARKRRDFRVSDDESG